MILLEKEIIRDIIDDMDWSFSRLNSFYSCKKIWYLTYIMKRNERTNFFSEYGTFIHNILEKYNKNQLEIFELLQYFEKFYLDEVKTIAPPNKFRDLNDLYYSQAIDFFSEFNGYNDETIGAELKFSFIKNILGKNRKFIGVIDRLSKDENGYVITDYKSKAKFSSKKEQKKYARQLYMYSYAVKEMFGEFPYLLKFEHFRKNTVTKIFFNTEDFNETFFWIENTIDLIYNENLFSETENEFFCGNLCGATENDCNVLLDKTNIL